jgi:hypothetical protein
MRPSQIALLAAIGIVIAVLLATAAFVALGTRVVADAELSGARSTRSPSLDGFTGVSVQGQWDLRVERAETYSVELSYPTALENRVSAEVSGGRLVIGEQILDGVWTRSDGNARMTARITMPALAEISLAGTSKVVFSGFEGDTLDVHAAGTSNVEGSASRYDDLELQMSGMGEMDLRDVRVTNARVIVSGMTDVKLNLGGGALTGNVSGMGSLRYYGTVSAETVTKSGLYNISPARR